MGKHLYFDRKREALRKKVVSLYKQDMTFRQVGKALAISHETARKLFNEVRVDK